MAHREVITEEILQAAIAALDARITAPVPPMEKRYSRREAFLKLRTKAREALAAGHSLETVLDDLKGVGLGLTISTARQYLKPHRRTSNPKTAARTEPTTKPSVQPVVKPVAASVVTNSETNKGTFTVTEDDNNL